MPNPSRRRRAPALAAASAAVLSAVPAFAADVPWVGGTGNYLAPANWQGGAIPAGGANAAVVGNGGTAQLGGDAPQIGGLVLGNGVGTSGTLAVSIGALPVANPTGSGAVQSGGVFIGANGGTGVLTMAGGTLSKGPYTAATDVGYLAGSTGTLNLANNAVFFQNWGDFRLGVGAGAAGTATLAGSSTLRTEFFTAIGFNGGTGGVTMTGDSTFQADAANNSVIVADGGGSLPGLPNNPNATTLGTLAMSGTSNFNVPGSTNLWVGQGNLNATGTLTMTDDAQATVAGALVIGRVARGVATLGGNATLRKTGGNNGDFIIANGTPSGQLDDDNAYGTLTLNDNAQASSGRQFWIGKQGTGVVEMNGASTLTAAFYIAVGRDGGTGTLTLNDDATATQSDGNLASIVVGSISGNGTLVLNDRARAISAAELWSCEGGGSGTIIMNDQSVADITRWVTIGRDSRLLNGVPDRGLGTLTLNDDATLNACADPDARFTVGIFGGRGEVTLNDSAQVIIAGQRRVEVGGRHDGGDYYGGGRFDSLGRLDVNGDARLDAPLSPLALGSGRSAGTVNLNSGEIRVASVDFGTTVPESLRDPSTQAPTAASSGTFHLNAGTLTTRAVTLVANAPGTHLFRFNGGTLRAALASDDFFQLDASRSEVAAGGARIDTDLFDVRVRQQLDGVGGLTKLGVGTLRLDRAPKNTGPLDVQAGTVRVASPAALGDPASRMTFSALAVAPGATLDVGTNLLVIDYAGGGASPLGDVRALLAAGRLTAGIDVAANVRLGYAEAAGLSPTPAAFGAVDATAVLVRATLAGDADLSGGVAFADLAAVASNYNAIGKFWADGDFNYDGAVSFPDLAALAANYNAVLPSPLVLGQQFGASFAHDWALALAAAVPEPAALLGAAGAAGVLGLRRRR